MSSMRLKKSRQKRREIDISKEPKLNAEVFLIFYLWHGKYAMDAVNFRRKRN